MNALDQAFIKAFAKDRTEATRRPTASAATVKVQPPDEGVESVALVLHELYQQGRRLRIDRPTSEAGTIPKSHTLIAPIESVDTYEPEELGKAASSAVIVEDRLGPLDLVGVADSGTPDPGADATLSHDDDSVVTELPENESVEIEPFEGLSTGECDDEAEPAPPSAARHLATDGHQEESDSSPRAVPGRVNTQDEPAELCESPQVLFAVPEAVLPDLETEDLGRLACQESSELGAGLTAAEIGAQVIDPLILDQATQVGCVASENRVDEGVSGSDCLEASNEQQHEESPQSEHAEYPPNSGDGATPLEESTTATLPLEVPESDELPATDPFTPAWEVDAFRWPEICVRLDESCDRKISESGEELSVATQDGLKVLAVTSVQRSEGRTTLALSLARSAAEAGSRVALLDADSSNPELARRLGLESPCDWQEVVRRQQPVSEAAVASLDDRITLFPLTVPSEQSTNPLSSESCSEVLRELGRHFDLVVVDMQPVTDPPADPTESRKSCPIDMAVVVRNVRTTSQDVTLEAVSQLRAAGVRAVGIVENFAPPETRA